MNCGRLPTTETIFTEAGDYWPAAVGPVVIREAREEFLPRLVPPSVDQVGRTVGRRRLTFFFAQALGVLARTRSVRRLGDRSVKA
jgi:hypothetical protein